MGQRLIDANELPKLFYAEFKQTMKLIRSGEKQLDNLAEGFAEAIHIAKYIAPTVDAVPVVRCRECKYFESASGYCNFHSQYYDGGGTWEIFKADDFCSCGERKEDTP